MTIKNVTVARSGVLGQSDCISKSALKVFDVTVYEYLIEEAVV